MRLLSSFLVIFCVVTIGWAAPLPNTIHTCTLTDGRTVSVSETHFNASQMHSWDLVWVTGDNQVVFARTSDGYVWRSTDEGFSWNDERSKMAHIDDTPEHVLNIFSHESADKHLTLYFVGSQGHIWVSKDAGETYIHETGPVEMSTRSMRVNRLYPGVVLVTVRTAALSRATVYISQDFAHTWEPLPVAMDTYGAAFWSSLPSTNPLRIYMRKSLDHPHTIIYSDTLFKEYKVMFAAGAEVLTFYAWPPSKALVLMKEQGQAYYHFELSVDSGDTWSKVEFPEEIHPANAQYANIFEVADDASFWTWIMEGCVFDGCFGDLFHSDDLDKELTLSLKASNADFEKYYGIDGVYITNQMVLDSYGKSTDPDLMRTLITWNRGSSWNVLPAPELNANNQPYTCANCSLHLHGWSGSHSPMYSIPNAPGLMVANGNVGVRLRTGKAETNTYLSWDGGVTWKEVIEGPMVPEIGDHGAVVILVDEDDPVNEVHFTVNEGKNWEVCQFSSDKFEIDNIRVSEGWDSKRFVMHGTQYVNNEPHVVLFQLNFDSAFTHECKKGSNDDFISWSAKSGTGECVLGEETFYELRKPGVFCFLPEDHVANTSATPCPCKPYDYECAHCWSRPDLSSPCQLECVPHDFVLPTPTGSCKNGVYEFDGKDFGYRLVGGDKCDLKHIGSSYPVAQIPCSAYGGGVVPGMAGGVVAAIIVFLLLVLVVGGVWVLWKHNQSFYLFVHNTFGFDDGRNRVEVYDHMDDDTITVRDDTSPVRLDDDDDLELDGVNQPATESGDTLL